MKLKVFYLNENLPENIKNKIKDVYFDFITNNKELALVEVAPVNGATFIDIKLEDGSEELDRIIISPELFFREADELVRLIEKEDFNEFIVKLCSLVGANYEE